MTAGDALTNASLAIGLVNGSAIILLVGTCLRTISFCVIMSLTKLYMIWICLVFP